MTNTDCGCPRSTGLGYQFHRYPCPNAGRIDPLHDPAPAAEESDQ